MSFTIVMSRPTSPGKPHDTLGRQRVWDIGLGVVYENGDGSFI